MAKSREIEARRNEELSRIDVLGDLRPKDMRSGGNAAGAKSVRVVEIDALAVSDAHRLRQHMATSHLGFIASGETAQDRAQAQQEKHQKSIETVYSQTQNIAKYNGSVHTLAPSEVGIGVEFSINELGGLVVESLVPGGPAATTAVPHKDDVTKFAVYLPLHGKPTKELNDPEGRLLLAGDELFEVNGEEVMALSPAQVSRLIAGQAGTWVHITVFRSSINDFLRLSIRRGSTADKWEPLLPGHGRTLPRSQHIRPMWGSSQLPNVDRRIAELDVVADLLSHELITENDAKTLMTLSGLGHPAIGDAIRACEENPRRLVQKLKSLIDMSATIAVGLAEEVERDSAHQLAVAKDASAGLALQRAKEALFVDVTTDMKAEWQIVSGPDSVWKRVQTAFSFHPQFPDINL